jgi:hypothetical protein
MEGGLREGNIKRKKERKQIDGRRSKVKITNEK